ncbi:MAG TPA: ABC transporter permease, partial [Terriglobales bacterium]
WFYKFPLRLRSLFRKDKADHELSAELQFHLQQLIDQNLALGMPRDEARYAALREFGGVAQVTEECREMREVSLIENILRDIRFSARTLLKCPGFTFVVVATLALGIGANTAIFSLVNRILLEPPPFPRPDRLVGVWDMSCPLGAALGYRQRLHGIDMGAYTVDMGFNLSGHGDATRLLGNGLSSNMFLLLGAKPELGRVFAPGDDLSANSRIVILSHELWQAKFGGRPSVVGGWVTLDDTPRQVVGVMPAGFHFPTASSQLWVPIEVDVSEHSLWGPFFYMLFGRLHDGVDLARAQAEFKIVVPQVVKTFPWAMGDLYGSWSELAPLQQHSVSDVRPTLLIMLGAVVLILMIACANVANLLLARSSVRAREMAIRSALGASRGRIVGQLLTESVLLAVLGGVLGCMLAFLSLRLLQALLPSETPGLANLAINGRVLGFSAAISLLTGLTFGLAPALRASQVKIEEALKANTQAAGNSRKRSRLSAGLVVAEIAFSVILVSAAGLLIKSLWTLSQIKTGFAADHVLTAQVTPTNSYCLHNGGCIDFYRQLIGELLAIPGVKDAATSDTIPLTGLPSTALAVEDRPDLSAKSPFQVWEFTVSPGYLETMAIPLLRGRSFTESDGAQKPLVVLVSKRLAEILWPGQDPIGKRVKPSWQQEWRTVVGVVDDVITYKSLPRGSATVSQWYESIQGAAYFPVSQGIEGLPFERAVMVRAKGDFRPNSLVQQLSAAVAKLNSTIPVSKVKTMDDVVSDSVSTPRSTMWIFTAFAGLALLLGGIGTYSVVSYSVSQRTREIGIRMALGANHWDVLKMILRQGSQLAAIGLAAGIAGALALTRFLASLLYGVRATDPATFLLVAVAVIIAALVATLIPSRRATKVDPTVALKYE